MKPGTMRNILITLWLTLMVAGCGWHLRGTGMIPGGLESVSVVSRDPKGSLVWEIRKALDSAGIKTPSNQADADLTLIIIREQSLIRVATINQQARVAEQELTELADFTVVDKNGDTVLPQSRVSVERIFEYNEENVLATQDERQLIQSEMRRDLINQILGRLRRIKLSTDAPAS